MKLNKRELTIVKCALSDYQYQFIEDTLNQNFLSEIITLLENIEKIIENYESPDSK